MPKASGGGAEYSRDREFGVILEDLRSQFQTFGEGLETVQERLERVETLANLIPEIKTDLEMIISAFRPFTSQVSEHETRINKHEKRLRTLETPS